MRERKTIRLQNYDYSQNGAYFVTICTHQRQKLFGDVGADSISAQMICSVFEETIAAYDAVQCPKYVVMPDHFHAMILIQRADMESAPTLSEVIQTFKRHTTVAYIRLVKAGLVPSFQKKVWQRSYFEHIIRNEQDYLEIWKYIEGNPLK